MRSASVIVLVVFLAGSLALLASGGGASDAQSAGAAMNAPPPGVETTLYFLTADRTAPIGVRRSLKRASPFAIQAMRALLAGRTQAEEKRGLGTAIPDGTELVSFRIVGNATAIINLSGLPQDGSPVERVRVITQITRSLIGLSGSSKSDCGMTESHGACGA